VAFGLVTMYDRRWLAARCFDQTAEVGMVRTSLQNLRPITHVFLAADHRFDLCWSANLNNAL
jgi:hypothetical protein